MLIIAIEDIEKYAEAWQILDATKLAERMQTDSSGIITRYGKPGFAILRGLVTRSGNKSLSEPERETMQAQLARILYQREQNARPKTYKFPHQRMRQYEALLAAWWDGVKKSKDGSVPCRRVERLLLDKSLLTEICNISVLAGSAEINLPKNMHYDDLVRLLARPMLCSSVENARSLLCEQGPVHAFLPLPLKVMRYQRTMYIGGLKKMKGLPQHQQDIIREIQERHGRGGSSVTMLKTEQSGIDLEEVERRLDGLIRKVRHEPEEGENGGEGCRDEEHN